jgi:hypothetical protein
MIMKRVLSALLLLVWSTSALAQSTPTITPLKKDDKAPYDGVLLNAQATAQIIADKQSVPEQIKLEVDKAVGVEQANSTFKLAELKSTTDADKKTLQAKVDASLKERDQWESMYNRDVPKIPLGYWIGGGVAVGIGITVLSFIFIPKVKL